MSILDHDLLKEKREQVRKVKSDFESLGYDPHKICIMPFANITLEPNGSVGICRQKGTKFSMGNIKDAPFDELWNLEPIKKWRRDFLNGQAKVCEDELKYRQCNLCPEVNQMLPEISFSEEIKHPLRLTANLNGFCNLECQMCDVWQLPNNNYTEENFWIPARKSLFPFLREIDLLSGEPLIQKDIFKLIEEVSSLNPDCLWSITTNAHWVLNSEMKKLLDKIKVKNIIVSIDSLDPVVFSKIRKKGKLEKVLNNLDALLEYEQERIAKGLTPLNFVLNGTIQKDNWNECPNLIDFSFQKKLRPFMTFCYLPFEYSLLSLPENEKTKVLDELLMLNWDYLAQMQRVWYPMVDSLVPLVKGHYLALFLEKKHS